MKVLALSAAFATGLCAAVADSAFLPSGRVALGANYWASHAATEMWRKWDAKAVDAKMHGGVGWEKMFDVYEYESRSLEETCAEFIRRSLRDTSCICGTEFTDKFAMWRIEGKGRLGLPRPACAIVTDGAGAVNGLAAKKGDRLLVANEQILETEGRATLVVCV